VALSQPVVFPLFGILSSPDSPRCACGNAECGRVGKHPAVAWGELSLGDEVPRPEPGAGYGLKTGAAPKGSGVFVVDLDGEAALEWWAAQQDTESDTYTVETGRGFQLYFQHPGFPVRNSAGDLAKGVDIRGDGGFVVGPGSPHKNGKTYAVVSDVPPGPAPAWLVDWLQARPAAAPLQEYPGDVDGTERVHRRRLYTEYLQTTTPCIQGQGGDPRLYEVVQRGAYDYALPVEDVLELVREHFDPRCEPPWGGELDERVRHKAHSAKTASTRPRAEPPPADLAELFGLTAPDPPPPPEEIRRARPASGIVWGAWHEPVEPPTYLVHGHIPIGTVGMFVALGSSLKTWTALDIGLSVARGSPWLGRFGTRSGKVLIVDYESGLYEMRRRVHVLKGADAGDALGVWAYPQERIDDVDFWKRIAGSCDWVESNGGLVVVDSLAAGAVGVDENDARVATPMKYAARFTEATGAAVLFIHHARKDDGDDRKMARGSTAIYADCDWAYKFENIEETRKYRRMHMVNIKPSMGPKPAPVHLELTDENGLAWFDEGGEAAKVKATEDTPEAIQAAIRLALANGPIETKHKLAKAVGRRPERVGPEVEAMLVRRELSKIPGQGFVLDDAARRLERILARVREHPFWKSEAAIAKAADASTEDVRRAVREAKITHSADGRWIEVSAR
jgi:hypothetical protein